MAKIPKSKLNKEEPNIVWSDDGSHLKPKKKAEESFEPAETLLRVRLEKKGRGGKTVTVVYELPDNASYFKKLTKKLKNKCGTGGSFKGDSIEIQGDRRDDVVGELKKEGFQVKISGG